MKNSMRNWHNWMGAALGLPLLLVGLTTFFIAHEHALGTKDMKVPFASRASEDAHPIEIRSTARFGDDVWLGTRYGVFRLDGDNAELIPGSPNDEIRSMVRAGDAVLLAGKTALWRLEDGKATAVYQADCWHVTSDADGYAATFKDKGVLVSQDGVRWAPRTIAFPEPIVAAIDTRMPVSKVIMDLHTGKFFFGKRYEWIWIDLLGLACVVLGLTGLVLWMRGRRTRADQLT
jgi:uncharacterized iron-regulated membrane protein